MSRKMTDEEKKKLSERTKKMWKDPEYRAKKIQDVKNQWADQDIRDKMILGINKNYSDNPDRSIRMSEITKKRYADDPKYLKILSEAHKGVHPTEETRKMMSDSRKKFLEEHPEDIEKSRDRRLGKPMPTSTRKKISVSLTGRKLSDSTKMEISKSNKGKKKSVATRLKLSNINKGKSLSEETCNRISVSNKGLKRTLDTCERISESKRGDKNYNWNGGSSFKPYCEKFNFNFKKRVRAFFGNLCIECGKNEIENGRSLTVHHVNYDKDTCCNNATPLFVVVCISCNSKANVNRDWWESHYTKIINEKYNGKCFFTKEEMKEYERVRNER